MTLHKVLSNEKKPFCIHEVVELHVFAKFLKILECVRLPV